VRCPAATSPRKLLLRRPVRWCSPASARPVAAGCCTPCGRRGPRPTLAADFWLAAGVRASRGCAVGRTRISLMVMCRGRVTANAMTSAMSPAVMASCSYIFSAVCLAPGLVMWCGARARMSSATARVGRGAPIRHLRHGDLHAGPVRRRRPAARCVSCAGSCAPAAGSCSSSTCVPTIPRGRACRTG